MLIVAGFVLWAFGLPEAKRAYAQWSGTRARTRAAHALAQGDMPRALLDAKSALDLNPRDAEAMRIIAKVIESRDATSALPWRQRLGAIHPEDAENLIAWARDALAAGYPDTAESVLEKVRAADRESAAYHEVAARIAMDRKDEEKAGHHWREAARLEPEEERFRLNIAVLGRKRGADGAREDALTTLRSIRGNSSTGRTAQRALIVDAMDRRDFPAAKKAADELASGPGAEFKDRLLRLSVLRAMGDPGATQLLLDLRRLASGRDAELHELLMWMVENSLSLLVLEWLPELPEGCEGRAPLCIAIADARARAMEWRALLSQVEGGSWGAFEFVRFAYKARALERLDDGGAAGLAWATAASVTEGRSDRLDALSKLAFAWRWEQRGIDLLWKMTASGFAPRHVLDRLWAHAARRGDTEQMCAVSRLRMNADPRSAEARNNFVFLSLVTRSTDARIHDIAEELHREMPENPEVVSTYAFSLYRRGRVQEALKATASLTAEQLRKPGVARYHGIFLAAAGRGIEAGEFFKLGEEGFILPEEKALADQVRAVAVGEDAAHLRKLDEAAASSKPEELPKVIRFMNSHGLAGLAADWARGLAPEIAARPEVRLAVIEALAAAFQWQRLREACAAGPWAQQECLRLAYAARAMLALGDAEGRLKMWGEAVASAAESGAADLERLARAAQSFGWDQEADEVLWRLAMEPGCPKWVAEKLWRSSLENGSAARLARSSELLSQADPKHERSRDAEIVAEMLRRGNESAIWEFAGMLRQARPGDPVAAVIHAIALEQQGRASEAGALIASLAPDSLKEPRCALFHGVYLTMARRAGEAAQCFEAAGAGSLLLQEKALIGKASAAAESRQPR